MSIPESTRKLKLTVFFSIFSGREDYPIDQLPASGLAGSVARKDKHMRYYLPLREKNMQGKGHTPSRMLPLWVWLLAIACLLLVVLALR